MRRKLDAHPREIENCRDPPNLMVVRHYGLEVERIEQLTLLTLAPPHHRNSPSMADSPRRNHGSLCSSRQFCNKIGPDRRSRNVCSHAGLGGKADVCAEGSLCFHYTRDSATIMRTHPSRAQSTD